MAAEQVIAELLVEVGLSVEGAKEAARKIKDVKDEAGDTQKKGGSKLKSFAKGAGKAFGAVAIAATAAAAAIVKVGSEIFTFVDETTAKLDQVAKGARQSGLGVEQFQRLAFAAERSGSNIEEVDKATRKIGVSLQDVAQGGGQGFVDTLASIGLSIEDIEGKDATTQLGLIGDAMNSVASDSEKAAIAAKLLGEEAGPRLIPLLNEGTQGIRDLGEAAGEVFTEEELAKSEAFQDSMTNFNQIVNKAKGDLATALAPALEGVIEKVTDWVAENDDFIKQKLPEIIEDIANILVDLLPIVADTIEGFHGFFLEVKQLDERLTEDFGPAWTVVKRAITAVLNPIGAVADAIQFVIDKITEFIQSSETLLSFAQSLGIRAFDKTTSVRGGIRPGETAEEREARLRAAEAAREREEFVEDFIREDVEASLRKNEEFSRKFKRRVVSEARQEKRKLTPIERQSLLSQGLASEQELDRIDKANTARRRGRGRGRGKKKKEEEEEKKKIAPVATLEEFLALTGEEQQKVQAGLFRKAKVREPVKPESVIYITNNVFDIRQTIEGVQDPEQAGRVAARMIREEFDVRLARAGQNLQTNVKR